VVRSIKFVRAADKLERLAPKGRQSFHYFIARTSNGFYPRFTMEMGASTPERAGLQLNSLPPLVSRWKFGWEISHKRSVDGRITKGLLTLILAKDELPIADVLLSAIQDPEYRRV
jgi:hypothetical protein